MANTTVKKCKQAHFAGDTFVAAGTVVGALDGKYTPATHTQLFDDFVVTSTS